MNETNANSKVEMDQAPESRDKLICPRCGKPIDPKEKKCPRCRILYSYICNSYCGGLCPHLKERTKYQRDTGLF